MWKITEKKNFFTPSRFGVTQHTHTHTHTQLSPSTMGKNKPKTVKNRKILLDFVPKFIKKCIQSWATAFSKTNTFNLGLLGFESNFLPGNRKMTNVTTKLKNSLGLLQMIKFEAGGHSKTIRPRKPLLNLKLKGAATLRATRKFELHHGTEERNQDEFKFFLSSSLETFFFHTEIQKAKVFRRCSES